MRSGPFHGLLAAGLPPLALAGCQSVLVKTTPGGAKAEKAHAAGAAALREGNPEKAIESFAEAWRAFPGYEPVAGDFPVALARLKKSGDDAYRQGNYEEAGRKWAAAARHLGHPAVRDNPPDFSRADLKAAMDKASAALMEKGLVEYRQGNLEAAVAAWKSILAYDPSHAEAAKSIRTASTQIENLKKLPPAN